MIHKALNNLFLKIWYNNNFLFRIIALSLIPFSILYYIAFNLKKTLTQKNSFSANIICVGNIVVGGSGKTTIALSLIEMLPNKKIVVLLRGYKGNLKELTKVKPEHTVIDVGDEALLYSQVVSTYTCSNRKNAINKIIENENPDLIILDDGLQDMSINKNKNIIAINGRRGFGNKLVLPAGPMRQTISTVPKNNSIFLIVGDDKTSIIPKYENHMNTLYQARLISNIQGDGNKIYAFSGVADNENFFDTLEKQDFKIINKTSFPDHYNFTDIEIKKIINNAIKDKVDVYTTSKDWKKKKKEYQDIIKQLPIKIEIDNQQSFIKSILS